MYLRQIHNLHFHTIEILNILDFHPPYACFYARFTLKHALEKSEQISFTKKRKKGNVWLTNIERDQTIP